MFKFLFDLLGSQRFEKPMTTKKRVKRKAEKGISARGIPPNLGAGRNNYISREQDTHTETDAAKDYDLITALVFIQEETGSAVIHLNGFESEEHAQAFTTKLMKKSGINYNAMNEINTLPTIH